MSKNKNVPAYLSLVLDILTRAQALGLEIERDFDTDSTLPEPAKGYVHVFVGGGDAAMIIPKHSGEVKWCDSHIDWEGNAGYEDHRGGGGAVVCRVIPSELDLDAYLTALSGASRQKRKGSKKSSKAALEEMKAKLLSLGLSPASEPASQEPEAAYPAEDLEFPADDEVVAEA